MSPSNISSDLIWELVRNNNAYLVKRKTNGGVQLSRDPFNLTNKHSRTHAGFVNEKAVSVQSHGEKGVHFQTKKSGGSHKPASAHHSHPHGPSAANRKIYRHIAKSVGKQSYRADLTPHAVARASAIRNSQRVKKDRPATKPRGAAAKKEASA